MKKFIKKILKKSRIIRKIYSSIIENYNKKKEKNVNIDEITQLYGDIGIDNGKLRINLLIPTLKKEFVFGGINTALKIFHEIASTDFDKRIILTDSDVHEEDLVILNNAKIISIKEKSNHPFQVIACNDRKFNKLLVTENDVFIATTWWSAYMLFPFIQWQNSVFHKNHKLIYLIQDYEPGFQAWSSRYILAESTYRHYEETIAIFNTKLLMDFFQIEGYKFVREYYFEPVLNKDLKEILIRTSCLKRKKQMIVYGRPSVDRNCFEIIVGAVRELIKTSQEAKNWEFLSLGETHPDIDLGDGKLLKSKGKVSLTEYANIMLESSVGLSLMISPHPSYPPLEMSTFGVITITNSYKNKNLKKFNSNIRSVNCCDFKTLSLELIKAMEEYEEQRGLEKNSEFLLNEHSFQKMCLSINELLKQQDV